MFLRSPHAHAKIRAIDLDGGAGGARACSAVYTGDDVAADGLGMPKAACRASGPTARRCSARARPALASERVRYVGDPVAMVVAETLAQAKDAAELIEIDYEPLPSVTDTERRGEARRAAVWDECPDNISNLVRARQQGGDRRGLRRGGARRQAALCHHAASMPSTWSRAARSASTIRARTATRSMPTCSTRTACAICWRSNVFKVPESKIRVIAGDVGGGFGTKGWQYLEHRLVLWAARKLRRPVKWTCERSEAVHGRRAWPRQYRRDRAGARPGRTSSSACGSTCSPISAPISAPTATCSTPFGMIGTRARRLLTSRRPMSRSWRVLSNTNPHRALSRRRPARGDLSHRAADRRRGARARRRPRSSCAART